MGEGGYEARVLLRGVVVSPDWFLIHEYDTYRWSEAHRSNPHICSYCDEPFDEDECLLVLVGEVYRHICPRCEA